MSGTQYKQKRISWIIEEKEKRKRNYDLLKRSMVNRFVSVLSLENIRLVVFPRRYLTEDWPTQ